MTSRSAPTTTNVMPTARSVSRRRPLARYTAMAKSATMAIASQTESLPDQLHGGLHRPQLIRLHDHDPAGVRAEPFLDVLLGQADAVGQLLDDRRQVEHDLTLTRLQEPALVVDDADEGFVGAAVRLFPERLYGRAAEQVVGRTCRELPQAAGDRGRQRLHLWRKAGLEARRQRRRSRTAGRRDRARESHGSRRLRAAASLSPPTCRYPAPAVSPRPSAPTRGRSRPRARLAPRR